MDNGAATSPDRCEGAADQILACLSQNLDGYVFWNTIFVDESADKIEIGAGGSGEADLDFLKPHGNQRIEEAVFALGSHRLDERLIAVAKVDAAPHRRARDCCSGPAPVGQLNRRKRSIFSGGIGFHDPARSCASPRGRGVSLRCYWKVCGTRQQ